MRSFSRLPVLPCCHAEVLPRPPNKRRDDAAAVGTLFHGGAEYRVLSGQWSFDFPEPVAGWLRRMAAIWTPPPGCEAELAVGLADEPQPRYVPVKETEPHVYVAQDGVTPLLTAGRADLVWVEDGVLYVCDIKTGASWLGPPENVPQLQAQGLACLYRVDPNVADAVRVGVYYARLGIFDWSGLLDTTSAWANVRARAKMTTEPRPGSWCLSCYSRKECEANPERKEAA